MGLGSYLASGRKNGLGFCYQQEELLLTGRKLDQDLAHVGGGAPSCCILGMEISKHNGNKHWTNLTTRWRTDEETQGDTGDT